MSRKAIEQRQEAETKITQIKKTWKKIDSGLTDQHEYDNYDINESQNNQSNGQVDLDKMEGQNIS